MRKGPRFEIGRYYLSRRPNSDSWCATWFDPATRQTRRESLGTSDFGDAQIALAKWVTINGDRDREQVHDAALGEIFMRYYHKHGQHVRSASSMRRNLFLVLDALPPDISVAGLTLDRQHEAVRKLKAQGLAAGTIKRAMGGAKAAINFAWKNGELDRPIPFLSLPDGQGRERVLTIDELATLWDAEMPSHMRVFLALLIGTAGRPESLLQLTRSQCDLTQGFINLNPMGRTQTKKRRPILPIADFLRPWIAKVESGPLVAWRGKPVQKINKTWRTIRESAGLDDEVVPYTIRHTIPTEMARRGVPPVEIAAWMGHSLPNFRTTARYTHVSPEYLANARQAVDEIANAVSQIAFRPMDNINLRTTGVLADQTEDYRPAVKSLSLFEKNGAGEGIRTLDPNLGKVVLYP